MIEMQNNTLDRSFKRHRVLTVFAAVAALVCLGFALVAGTRAYESGLSAFGVGTDTSLNSTPPVMPAVNAAGPEALSQAFSSVAKAVGPAVVHINVVKEVQAPVGQFGFGFRFPGDGPNGPTRQEGSGSGVIVNPNGFIITNNHVVGDAKSIEVKLADGRRLKGTVVGTDEPTDIAVVKVDASDLPAATLGVSEKMQQGDWVVAVGSPFGLEQTITAGIVSATGRRLQSSPYDAFIQTDASINPGNSGGPLVNLRGEVVGINTMIFTKSGGNQGIGFAIPSDMVKKVYDQLVSGNGKVVRGYMGIAVADLTPAIAESLNVPAETKGALVSDVASEASPAAKAGLKSGDVITGIEGKAVGSAADLTSMVADFAPGTSINVAYIRDGASKTTSVTLIERPSASSLENNQDGDDDANPQEGTKLGIQVRDLTPEIASQVRSKSSIGAVVVGVDPAGPAASAGLQRGDVIVRIGKVPVASAKDLTNAVASFKSGETVVLQVERGRRMAFITVELD